MAQSPGKWFHNIDPVLVDIGFVSLKSDTCVYAYNREGVKIILTLYVDDLLLAGNNAEAMAMVKSQLKQRFKMTDMGEAPLVLGIEIKRDRQLGTLTISQEAYSKAIRERFGMSDCKPTSTPGYGLPLQQATADHSAGRGRNDAPSGHSGVPHVHRPRPALRPHLCNGLTGLPDF